MQASSVAFPGPPVESQAEARRKRTRHRHRAKPSNPQTSGNDGSASDTPASHSDEDIRPVVGTSSRGRGGGHRGLRAGALAFRPASVAPPNQSHAHVNGGAQPVPRGPKAQAGRGGGIRGGKSQSIVGTRQFGGSLTTPTNSQPTTSFQVEAAEFKPGQPYQPAGYDGGVSTNGSRTHGHRGAPKKKRRLSKSTAPDLASRIHEDIDAGNYECAICTSEVVRRSKIWSCHTCWTVFHLDCIKKWSSNSEAGQGQQNANGEPAAQRTWRCPGCNLHQDVKPRSYHCWCEKEHEPRTITGLPPHSCGQTCGTARVLPRKCPHPCELLCHAGPCPPCTHTGPTQRCFCGKESSTRRCVDTNYETGWSCGKICGDDMPCGEHTCPRECHEGLCGACEVRLDARCYCGKVEKAILCCDKDDDRRCTRGHQAEDGSQTVENWTGLLTCTNSCERPFDCGKHTCQKLCHAASQVVTHCPRSPDVVTHCPCTKTRLSEITDVPRKSCEDVIPNCSKTCLKVLPCGHGCQQKCHTSECLPCLEQTEIHCRCGRTTSSTICHQGSDEPPQCIRTCHVTLNCGRHECGERCCAGERKGAQRAANKRKQRPLNTPNAIDDGFEAEHICTRPCGRTLKCGNHSCEELCHRGPCGSCREAIFDEISCHCGRTILQPPLPCGTKPPLCRYPCERPKGCGHPQVQHNCHQDDEVCPKCPYLMEKQCMCGRRNLKNQKCWSTEVRCGEICGRKLRCGSHTCRKTCHRPGECEDSNGVCTQACGKPKRACNHPCEEKCHAPYPCKEDRPCPQKALITCPCQHLKQEIRCNASSVSEGNTTKALTCNDECARLLRNRKLALALNIDPETHTDDHVPYSTETLSLFQALESKWATDQEREFRVFASDEEEKRLRFKPMPSSQRSFLHSLAEDFGLDSESMDPEPHRHVAIFKTPRFVSAPNKTLRDCVRIRRSQATIAAQQQQAERQQSRAQRSNEILSWNGLLLTNVRFALTIDELESETRAVLGPNPASKIAFNIQFLPDGNVALKAIESSQDPSPAGSDTDDPSTSTSKILHTTLTSLKAPLFRAFAAHRFGNLQLARYDASLNVLRRESDSVAGGGWSQVAAKAAAPRRVLQPQVNELRTGGFTVLGNLNNKKKLEAKKVVPKKAEEEDVVEDWADAVEELDAKDARANGAEAEAVEPAPGTQDDELNVDAENTERLADAVCPLAGGNHEDSAASQGIVNDTRAVAQESESELLPTEETIEDDFKANVKESTVDEATAEEHRPI